ncbi:uncharacterized protein LOC131598458 [Vicia villosa]|uniref:uncharacterized protein LOC131598458 n=1 Tax=Vicia villosa TaxID=3911 RepID=UPI00273BB0AD|nr:uncharacterized protein LOC131598458 [Vicia villosa]
MISTWNVRGINKEAKHREVCSYFSTFHVPIIALLETRVKEINASRIRNKFGNNWAYIDNYSHHYNGRIWVMWKDKEVTVTLLQKEEQFIHLDVISADKRIHYLATIVYAMNQLERRKCLWEQIENLGTNTSIPWIVMGDYNNVLTSQDRIGGNQVNIAEYKDLADMMHRTGLFEAPTRGRHFTWFNNHSDGAIYSIIDRLIANVQWFQTFQDAHVEVLHPNVSDHSPLRVLWGQQQTRMKMMFKFLNCVTTREGYFAVVKDSWEKRTKGNAMQRLWCKLKRLQGPVQKLQRSYTDIQLQIQKAIQDLNEAHLHLSNNMFDCDAIA